MKKIDIKKALSTPSQVMYNRFVVENNPCMNVSGRFDITHIYKLHKKGHKLNALLCYAILKTAESIKEYHYQIKSDGLYYFDHCKVNMVFKGNDDGLYWGDVLFTVNYVKFEKEYERVSNFCIKNHQHLFEEDGSLISTSAIIGYPFTSISLPKSDVFWDNFVTWGKFEKKFFKVKLNINLRFHHALIDGEHAAIFFTNLQKELNSINIK